MYTTKQIAKWFIENTDEKYPVLTPLKLQKLLYYVQSWSLALYDEVVFDDEFEAWAHGPVVRDIYFVLNQYRYHPIPKNEFLDVDITLDEKTEDLLTQIQNLYGVYDAKYLENLTHQETPWIAAREGLSPEERCQNIITQDSMREFYKEMQNS